MFLTIYYCNRASLREAQKPAAAGAPPERAPPSETSSEQQQQQQQQSTRIVSTNPSGERDRVGLKQWRGEFWPLRNKRWDDKKKIAELRGSPDSKLGHPKKKANKLK